MINTAVSHLEFEALHPFQNGNGRIGRMLITLMLWQSKTISAPHFYISGYFEEHKERHVEFNAGGFTTGAPIGDNLCRVGAFKDGDTA